MRVLLFHQHAVVKLAVVLERLVLAHIVFQDVEVSRLFIFLREGDALRGGFFLVHEFLDGERLLLFRFFDRGRHGGWRDDRECEVWVDDDLVVVSGQLEEPINVAELVLVNDGVLTKVDVVHRLRQIHEGPALETNIFRGL